MTRWWMVLCMGMVTAVFLAASADLQGAGFPDNANAFAALHAPHHAGALPLAQTDSSSSIDWQALWTQIQSLLTQLMGYIIIYLNGMLEFVSALLGSTTS